MSKYLELLATLGIGGAHPGGLELTKQLLEKETILNGSLVLDAGCGTGQTAAYLKDNYNIKVTAVDYHPLMIKKAQQRFNEQKLDIELLVGNVESLQFSNKKFDYILSESVISFTDIHKAISEFVRVLKQRGVLIAIEMTSEDNLSDRERKEIQDFYGMKSVYTLEQWRNLFKKAGFQNVSLIEVDSINDHTNHTEFALSAHIDDHFFNMLDKHEQLTNKYKNKISFRVYRCQR